MYQRPKTAESLSLQYTAGKVKCQPLPAVKDVVLQILYKSYGAGKRDAIYASQVKHCHEKAIVCAGCCMNADAQ